MTNAANRRVATYERVSTEDQRERATIKTQTEVLARQLQDNDEVELVRRYVDDGISGTIPLSERPAGSQLLQDALKGQFDEVWVYKLDRLGRDVIDPLVVRKQLNALGVKVVSATENIEDDFTYDLHVVLAARERKVFLERSAAGIERAAREGRYIGGIAPYGYIIEGRKANAKLKPCHGIVWADLSEVDVIRKIYGHLANDGWSCHRVAQEFNELGIPTSYAKDDRNARRGQRKVKTTGKWRGGRIRNVIANPIYKGILQYGRRSQKPGREIISASCPRLVSDEMWEAAQQTLKNNRVFAQRTGRVYLLRSVMHCGVCGLNYCGTYAKNRNAVWYRCNGRLKERGTMEGMCYGKGVKGTSLEPTVWNDIETFLRDPGAILEQLEAERSSHDSAAIAEAERITLEEALRQIAQEKDSAIHLRVRGTITDEQLDELLLEIGNRTDTIENRIKDLIGTPEENETEEIDEDMLEKIRARLDEGLTELERQEIVTLLVKRITIHTDQSEDGKTRARAVIEYRFPKVVVQNCTGRDS